MPPPTVEQPLTIIGTGPVGLAAAAHAVERGLPVRLLEAGGRVADAVGRWGHVRTFSPWRELVDAAAMRLLEPRGWSLAEPESLPTGDEWRKGYLQPLAAALRDSGAGVRLGARVIGVARQARDRIVAGADRGSAPFSVHVTSAHGHEVLTASAVIDASGTYDLANPLGSDGYPAPGEREAADRITYGIPDLGDPVIRERFEGRHVVVAGSGASAQSVLVGLGSLAERDPETRVTWLLRRDDVERAFGGQGADGLEARGKLGSDARMVATSEAVSTLTGFRTVSVAQSVSGGLSLTSHDGQRLDGVDEVIAVTGYRPDHSFLDQVHLDLDGELGAPSKLAPEIHPAFHSCGTVSPHGANLLRQPEPGLYLAGMKSYGRAPSFLTMTGFEQVRSIVAEVAGDQEAADRVELVLPETGVCGVAPSFAESSGGGCCG